MPEGGTLELQLLKPEDVPALLAKDLEAIREKVENKKPLSEAEIRRLQQHMAGAAGWLPDRRPDASR